MRRIVTNTGGLGAAGSKMTTSGATAPTATPLMFTILHRTAHGWTDNIGPGENSWATEAEADDAVEELRVETTLEEGVAYAADWKVVPTEDLANYELVA